jgi:hypothetical protein
MKPLWQRFGSTPGAVAGFFTMLSWIAAASVVCCLILLAIEPSWHWAKLAFGDAIDFLAFRLARTGWLMAQGYMTRYVNAEADAEKARRDWRIFSGRLADAERKLEDWRRWAMANGAEFAKRGK